MRRNFYLFLVFALTCFTGKSLAQTQPCYTDEVRKRLIAKYPQILQYEADFNRQVKEGLKNIDLNKYKRTTAVDESGNDSFWYDIPIVIHVIHDYNNGTDYLTDNDIYNDFLDWNVVYAGQNTDLSSVITPFIPYIGIPHIRLHLATKDPNGNATHGITRHRSYLTYIGGDQSKLDDWPPSSYVNIWTVNIMSLANAFAAAYAYQPPTAALLPQGDGVICLWNYLNNDYTGVNSVSKTINHEIGHVFNLEHPWGNTNSPELACGDDLVDDTPPTHGHDPAGCNADTLADTACATNYFVVYPSVSTPGIDSLVNYPDTTNAQNIMDYTYCARMFTKGQVARMHAALNSTVAFRTNLWDSTNLELTGVTSIDGSGNIIFTPRLDLKPIPEFNVTATTGTGSSTNYMTRPDYFVFPGKNVAFTNETWNDTLTSLTWNFSNGAAFPTCTSSSTNTYMTYVNNRFSIPGWVTLSMTATGNGSGDTTVGFSRAVFVADTVGTAADGFYEDFNTSDTANWPMFNYYNNEFKWQMANVGFNDNSSIQYTGYDNRVIADTSYPFTGNPQGDFDDFFSVPMDLSSFATDTCNLNFFYSAASRSSLSDNINDTLEIDYSLNKGSWTVLKYLSRGTLINKGAVATAYTPASQSDWAPQSIGIPRSARSNYVTFRFRYRPGQTALDVNGNTYSSGNNFYMDHINFSSTPASVSNVMLNSADVVVVPNPTNGDAYIVIKDASNTTAKIVVTDITGKVVFTTEQAMTTGQARVQIPHDAIAVKGVYIVETVTGNQVHTQKLIAD